MPSWGLVVGLVLALPVLVGLFVWFVMLECLKLRGGVDSWPTAAAAAAAVVDAVAWRHGGGDGRGRRWPIAL